MICDDSLADLLERYIYSRELKPSTEAYYRRTLHLYREWSGSGNLEHFTPLNVSKFLAAKQATGTSSYYRKGLRNGLVALLRFAGHAERVRPVKLHSLEPEAWSTSDIAALLEAVPNVATAKHARRWWSTLIQAAWYTGLSQCDLLELRRNQIDARGVVRTSRSKTGKPVVAWIPLEVVEHCQEGLVWPWPSTKEWFRQVFARIVKAAGLHGSFKKLRKSSGSSVEKLHPGRGHEHLANDRAIFERHYHARQNVEPLRPESLTTTEPDLFRLG